MSKFKLTMRVQCAECGGTGYIEVTTLQVLRQKTGYSQEDVAEKLGITRTAVSNIERGVQNITIDKIAPMSEVYGVTEHEMYDIAKLISNSQGTIGKLSKGEQ